jgi:hypothetical protein
VPEDAQQAGTVGSQNSGFGRPSASGLHVTDAARTYMLRRLLGHITLRIMEAQDALSIVCAGRTWMDLSREQREWAYAVNEALRPWIFRWIGLSENPRHRKLHATWRSTYTDAAVEDDHVVYLRLNIHNGDTYVGKTSFYLRRFNQHFRAVLRHHTGVCKHCREHRKYTRQATLRPTQWITVPINVAASGGEALRVERWMIRYLDPSLNAGDKPFWLHRRHEDRDASKARRRGPRRGVRRPREKGTSNRDVTYTQYRDEDTGRTWLDPRPLIEDAVGSGSCVRLRVTPGSTDIAAWVAAKKAFPLTFCRVDAEVAVCMRSWDHRRTVKGAPFSLYLEPRARHLTKAQLPGSYLDLGLPSADWVPGDSEEFEEFLARVSETQLEEIWKIRTTTYEKYIREGGRNQIWSECKRRYYRFTNTPITIAIPRPLKVDFSIFKAQVKRLLSDKMGWPAFLVEWHMRNLRISRSSPPSVGDVLANVNKPWRAKGACTCERVTRKLRELGSGWCPPVVNGHIFFTGREYGGPSKRCLNVCSTNIPAATRWDLKRTWYKVAQQLPIPELQRAEIDALAAPHPQRTVEPLAGWPTTKDLYNVRKALEGLVIGPLDKNPGELWCCCPCLYEEALGALYDEMTGYTEVIPRKLTSYQTKKHGRAEVHKYVLSVDHPPPRSNQHGSMSDVIRAWRLLYREKGWNRFGKFNSKGGFGTPYALFKAKNVVDPAIRREKWKKARPIAPETRHPMRQMLHKAGRAWYFVTADVPGERFAMPKVGDIPQLLTTMARQMASIGPYDIRTFDIEGCFCAMPTTAIHAAMRELVAQMSRSGRTGVWVPRADSKPCQWDRPEKRRVGTWIPFAELGDIMEFALTNAFVRMPDGRILKQTSGIPMGGPLSPAMCNGTCAWMEREWMSGLGATDKMCFSGARYMDDILLLTSQAAWWDRARFLEDFTRSECYWGPLKLEDAGMGCFLESTFFPTPNGEIRYRLKNVNEHTRTVWRYHHYRSQVDYATKRAILFGALRKVDKMASDPEQLVISAMAKCEEFLYLEYPRGILRHMCTVLARETGHCAWLTVKNHI